MEDNVPFKMEVNLQNLSICAIATKFWGSPPVKENLRENFSSHNYGLDHPDEFIDQMVTQFTQAIYLPENVLVKIRDTIGLIGEKVFLWISRVKNSFNLGFEHAVNIGWTCYGTVDEDKTFQLYLQNGIELILDEHIATNQKNQYQVFRNSLFSIACMFGQEAFVSRNFNVMKRMLADYCEPEVKIPAKVDKHTLMKIWVYCYFRNIKLQGQPIDNDLKSKGTDLDTKLVEWCADAGYVNAFKYFADNLKEERAEYCFRIAVLTSLRLRCLDGKHDLKDNYIEIMIFLMRNMPVEKRNLFLRENIDNLFYGFISVWPYQEVVLNIINYTYFFMTENDEEKLLESVLLHFVTKYRRNRRSVISDTICLNRLLQKILESVSNEVKNRQIRNKSFIFYNLFMESEFSTLKILASDPHLASLKEEMIKMGVEFIFKSRARNGEYESLGKYIKEFLNEDEKKEFRNKFNNLEELVAAGNFELAEKLVNILTDSNEEKALLKRKINSVKILTNKRNFSLSSAVKLLTWQFDGDEKKIKSVKIALRKNKFIRQEFYRIWCGHCISSVEISKTKCSEFLTFFFDSDEIETFKRDVIIGNEHFIEMLCDNLHFSVNFNSIDELLNFFFDPDEVEDLTRDKITGNERFTGMFVDKLMLPKNLDCIDELLKFCCVPLGDVKKMKQKVLDDIEHWILIFGIYKQMFVMADAIVNWVVEDEEKKKTVIENFMNSSRSGELFSKVVSSKLNEDILVLLNVWLPSGNVPKILESCSYHCFSDDKSRIESLLTRLEEIGYVTEKDLEEMLLDNCKWY